MSDHCAIQQTKCCDLAMLTLQSPLSHSVGPLCYPADYVETLLGIREDSVSDSMDQASKGE